MTTHNANLNRSRRHMRTGTLILCALAAVGLQVDAGATADEKPAKLKILFLTVDDVGLEPFL